MVLKAEEYLSICCMSWRFCLLKSSKYACFIFITEINLLSYVFEMTDNEMPYSYYENT